MKILFSAEFLYPPQGGADISARTLLEELAKEHEVYALYTGDYFKTNIKLYPIKLKKFKGVWIKSYFLNKKWEKILDKKVKEIKPDIIITQDYLTPSSVKIANKYNIKSIVFIRNYLHLCLHSFKFKHPDACNRKCLLCRSSFVYKIQYPFFRMVSEGHKKALQSATVVMPVSNYVANLTNKFYKINYKIIRPFINTGNYKIKSSKRDYITLINPDLHKGLEIFKKIVKQLPDKNFLVVGKEIKNSEPNLKVIPWTEDMQKIYSQTKILLLPSIWPDPCPRVVIEAMCSGIPCIVTNIGGAPEEVDKAGIVINNIQSIQEWTDAIKLLENPKIYKKYSGLAEAQAKKFDFKIQFKKFKSYISSGCI